MHAGGKNPGEKESREDKMKGVKLTGWKIQEGRIQEKDGAKPFYNVKWYYRVSHNEVC